MPRIGKKVLAEIRYQRSVISGMQIYGLAGDWSAVTNIAVQAGRMLDAHDQSTQARVAVIGVQLALELAAEMPNAAEHLQAMRRNDFFRSIRPKITYW